MTRKNSTIEDMSVDKEQDSQSTRGVLRLLSPPPVSERV